MKLNYQRKQSHQLELADVFNDYFTHVGPKLAEKIENENQCSFRDFIPQHKSNL